MLYEPSYMQPNLTNFDIEAEDSFFLALLMRRVTLGLFHMS